MRRSPRFPLEWLPTAVPERGMADQPGARCRNCSRLRQTSVEENPRPDSPLSLAPETAMSTNQARFSCPNRFCPTGVILSARFAGSVPFASIWNRLKKRSAAV
jgi:hypothetical protein